MKNKILFILKRREDYNAVIHTNLSLTTGLYNSVSFLDKMLNDAGIESKLIVVNDNNDIDREVSSYKPTHVIIEALWVVPSKFEVLQRLHPKVKWIIRLHSDMPFIANEGMAMSWIGQYMKFNNVSIACNSPKMFDEVEFFVKHKMGEHANAVMFLPNFYPQEYKQKKFAPTGDEINIGCFGAVRPLKNHLIQAHAAIKFADKIKSKLVFHVNADRVEMKGEPVVRNLVDLFKEVANKGHRLVNEGWLDRIKFLALCGRMDMGMQVSFSETFNIVAADMISQGVPVIGSDQIPWMSSLYTADPCESYDIYNKLLLTHSFPSVNVYLNKTMLTSYTNKTRKIWLKQFAS